MQKIRFLSSKKYDPGCSSRIPDPDADFLPSWIPDPGVKKAPNPGSGSATLLYIVFFLWIELNISEFPILCKKVACVEYDLAPPPPPSPSCSSPPPLRQQVVSLNLHKCRRSSLLKGKGMLGKEPNRTMTARKPGPLYR
jgi:hypothetical protein